MSNTATNMFCVRLRSSPCIRFGLFSTQTYSSLSLLYVVYEIKHLISTIVFVVSKYDLRVLVFRLKRVVNTYSSDILLEVVTQTFFPLTSEVQNKKVFDWYGSWNEHVKYIDKIIIIKDCIVDTFN